MSNGNCGKVTIRSVLSKYFTLNNKQSATVFLSKMFGWHVLKEHYGFICFTHWLVEDVPFFISLHCFINPATTTTI